MLRIDEQFFSPFPKMKGRVAMTVGGTEMTFRVVTARCVIARTFCH